MKAIGFSRFGDSSVLETLDVTPPDLKPGEVRIALSHTSVNPVDWKIREGYLQTMFPHHFPLISGWDAAGKIIELGKDVSGFKLGDEVYSYTRLPEVQWGTYAESIAIPSHFVSLKPQSLSLAEAAAVPLVGLTAWQALTEVGQLQKGQSVLILGASGGVGSFAVQFAIELGAKVAATTSPRNADYVRSLGAHEVLDYTDDKWTAKALVWAANGFDVVLDLVGGETLNKGESLVQTQGKVVSIVDQPTKGHFHFVSPNGTQLTTLAQLFESGKVKSPEIQIHSVKEAQKAQELSQAGRVRGKIVLKIDF